MVQRFIQNGLPAFYSGAPRCAGYPRVLDGERKSAFLPSVVGRQLNNPVVNIHRIGDFKFLGHSVDVDAPAPLSLPEAIQYRG